MTSIKDQLPKSHSLRSAPQPRRTGRDGLADHQQDGGVVPDDGPQYRYAHSEYLCGRRTNPGGNY